MWQSEQIEMYDDCEKNGLVNIAKEEEIGKDKNGIPIKKTSIPLILMENAKILKK